MEENSFKTNGKKVTLSLKIHHPIETVLYGSTIVIYTCVLIRDTCVNSSVEYCFIKFLSLQVILYLHILHM